MTPNLLLRCPGGEEGVQHCSIERSSYDFSVNDVIPLLLRCSLQEVESALSAADLRGSCTHSRILSVPTLACIILPELYSNILISILQSESCSVDICT